MATFVAKIHKKDPSGIIQLLDGSDVPYAQLMEFATIGVDCHRDSVIVLDKSNTRHEIIANKVTETQLEPAAPVAFSGDVITLFAALVGPFFTSCQPVISAGSGPVIESNITIVNIGAYAVLTTDYILWVIVDSTLTLPTIAAASIGRVYRIFARNVKVTINPSGGDTINNKAFIKLNKYDMVTLRAGEAGKWGIGD